MEVDPSIDLSDLELRLLEHRQALERTRKLLSPFLQGKPLLAGPGLENAHETLRRLRSTAAALAVLDIDALQQDLQRRYANARLQVEERFHHAIASSGWALTGEWPTYVVHRLVPVRFDMKGQRAYVADKAFRSLDLDKPLAEIQRLMTELEQRRFDVDAFVPALARAYEAAIAATKKRPGEAVPILDVLKELPRTSGYSSVLFGLDLARAQRTQSGRRLVLSPARRPDRAVYVPSLTSIGGTYVAGIRILAGEKVGDTGGA